MNTEKTDMVGDSLNLLQSCKTTLTDLSKTCCMPERSPNMNEAFLLFDNLITKTKEIEFDTQNAQKCIEEIGNIGGKIGYLYATCCTATREPHYQSIFKSLMEVHVKMWSVLGHTH